MARAGAQWAGAVGPSSMTHEQGRKNNANKEESRREDDKNKKKNVIKN
jgi:hypothetical protein